MGSILVESKATITMDGTGKSGSENYISSGTA